MEVLSVGRDWKIIDQDLGTIPSCLHSEPFSKHLSLLQLIDRPMYHLLDDRGVRDLIEHPRCPLAVDCHTEHSRIQDSLVLVAGMVVGMVVAIFQDPFVVGMVVAIATIPAKLARSTRWDLLAELAENLVE